MKKNRTLPIEKNSGKKEEKILVIGAGVIGLTVANLLLDQGFSVDILTKEWPHQTTSSKAGALWFPFHAGPREKVVLWARKSYIIFKELAEKKCPGVSMVPLKVLYERKTILPMWQEALPEEIKVRQKSLEENKAKIVDKIIYRREYELEVPLVEPEPYLGHLLHEFFRKGGFLRQQEILSFSELENKEWPIVVNATGLASRILAKDPSVYPSKGHMVQLDQTISSALFDEASSHAPAYIFPRCQGAILGGTVEEKEESERVNLLQVGRILEKTLPLVPELQHSGIQKLWVGFRPFRPEVRLEIEKRERVWLVHNYGHGGAGFTLSWGTAWETFQLIEKLCTQISS
ncbi:MAG: FAD-binding oxidoreductase [Planctomycetota bacterium]|nr:MAG: FAD-binding oxidoreductase [Planctomycetota bacterium]